MGRTHWITTTCLVALCASVSGRATAAPHPDGEDDISYRQFARDRSAFVDAFPGRPRSPEPLERDGYLLATSTQDGRPLWLVRGYTRGCWLVDSRHLVRWQRAQPHENAGKVSGTLSFYRSGEPVRSWPAVAAIPGPDQGEADEERGQDVAGKTGEPSEVIRIAAVLGLDDATGRFQLRTATDTVIAFDPLTGERAATTAEDAAAARSAEPATNCVECRAYQEAGQARQAARFLPGFSARMYEAAQVRNSRQNSLFSPLTCAATLQALLHASRGVAAEETQAALFEGQVPPQVPLKEFDRAMRGVMGRGIRPADSAGLLLTRDDGGRLHVERVEPGSPFHGSVHPGQEVLEVNGEPVASGEEFEALFQSRIGGLDLVLRTDEGERRSLHLPDGARMDLGPVGEVRLNATYWVPDSRSLRRGFQQSLANSSWIRLEKRSFAEPSATVEEVNESIRHATGGKVEGLVAPQALAADTRLLLTATLYCSVNWSTPFPAERTELAGSFILGDGRVVSTPVMHGEGRFPLLDCARGTRILEMPLRDRQLSWVVLLPAQPQGLPSLEKSLSGEWLQQIFARLDQAERQRVAVALPRFTIDQREALRPLVERLGCRALFDSSRADFSGLLQTRAGGRVTSIENAAHLTVDEHGLLAASATATRVSAIGVSEPPIGFEAVHPFLFLIRHRPTNAVLVLGKLENPAAF